MTMLSVLAFYRNMPTNNPAEDYDRAVASRREICPCCVKTLDEVKI